jgi:hypothetical protein
MTHRGEFDELVTRISVEAERLAEAGKGPSSLIDAVMKEGAVDLAALAAERHHHAAMTRLRDDHRLGLAERSPIFRFDDRTLIAAPIGALELDGLARFLDRVLSAVGSQRPSRVALVLQGFDPHEGAEAQLAAFGEELAAAGVTWERR